MLDPTPKRFPMFKDKGEAQTRWLEGKIGFRMKPHTCQRCLEGSNKTLCTPRPRDPTESEPDLPLSVFCRCTGQQRPARGTGALAAADLGGEACGISPLGGGHYYPTIEPLSRWPTNCRTIIPKTFLHYCKSSRAHNRFPNLGSPAKGLRTPRKFDFEGQWDLITELPQDWETGSWRAQTKTLSWSMKQRYVCFWNCLAFSFQSQRRAMPKKVQTTSQLHSSHTLAK